MHYIQQPQTIEANSFTIISDIIRETRPDYRFASPLHEAIIKRVIHTTADSTGWTFVVPLPMRWSSFVMRYAIRALFIPIPRWRCPALIKDYWRRLAASVAVISAIRAWCAPHKRRGLPVQLAAVDIAIAEEEKNKLLFR